MTTSATQDERRSPLRIAREAAGLSMRALATKAGVNQSTISRAEAGTLAPSDDVLARLAEACKTTPAALREADPPSPPHPEQATEGSAAKDEPPAPAATVPLHRLVDWSENPRAELDDEALVDLAFSIGAHGVQVPLTVRPIPHPGPPHPEQDREASASKDHYQVIDGQRRFLVLRDMADNGDIPYDSPVPVVIRELDETAAILTALVSNLARADMHPADEADAFSALRHGGMDTMEIAVAVGRTRRHVQARIRLAETLAPEAAHAWREDRITTAQAEAIADADDAAMQHDLLTMARAGYAPTEADLRTALEKLRATRRAEAEAADAGSALHGKAYPPDPRPEPLRQAQGEGAEGAAPDPGSGPGQEPHPEPLRQAQGEGPEGAAPKPHPEQATEARASKDEAWPQPNGNGHYLKDLAEVLQCRTPERVSRLFILKTGPAVWHWGWYYETADGAESAPISRHHREPGRSQAIEAAACDMLDHGITRASYRDAGVRADIHRWATGVLDWARREGRIRDQGALADLERTLAELAAERPDEEADTPPVPDRGDDTSNDHEPWVISVIGGDSVERLSVERFLTDKQVERFLRACHLPGEPADLDRITITRRDA